MSIETQQYFGEGTRSLKEVLGGRRKEFLGMIRDTATKDPSYKPTLMHPEHLLSILLATNEIPPDLFSGRNAELQERIFRENFPTIVSMLPDIVETNYKLRQAGYTHTENPLIFAADHTLLDLTANDYADVLHSTYPDGNGGTNYPLKQKNPQAIIDDVTTGKFDIYTVENHEGKIVAVFGNVRRADILGEEGYAVELGRTGTKASEVKEFEERGINLRGVSKLRLYHLLTDPRFIADPEIKGKSAAFIYSDIRLATAWNNHYQGGKGVQGVFFGGREYGERLEFGIASVGWRYILGRSEPMAFVFRPTFPQSYARDLVSKTLYIPDGRDAERVHKLIRNSFGMAPIIDHNGSMIHVKPIDPDNIEVALSYDRNSEGASVIFAKIDVVDTSEEFRDKAKNRIQTVSLSEALNETGKGRAPFIEVYVDATLGNGVNAERITGVVKTLKNLGFVCNGWTPSSRDGGNSIQVSFAKLGEGAVDPIPPDMPEKYYQNGLGETRNESLQIFQDLLDAKK